MLLSESEKFTISYNQQANSKIIGDLRIIVGEITANFPKEEILAIFLGGSLGRGEGSVSLWSVDGKPEVKLFGDYDIFVLLRRIKKCRRFLKSKELKRKIAEKTGESTSIWLTEPKEFSSQSPTLSLYELCSGYKLIYGNEEALASLKKKISPDSLPSQEASDLLWNRANEMLSAIVSNNSPKQAQKAVSQLINCGAKAMLAVGDAFLLLSGRYHFSYPEKERRLLREDIPFVDEEVREAYSQAVRLKTNPDLRGFSNSDINQWLWGRVNFLEKYHFLFESKALNKNYANWLGFARDKLRVNAGYPLRLIKNCCSNFKVFNSQKYMFLKKPMHLFLEPKKRMIAALPLILYSYNRQEKATFIAAASDLLFGLGSASKEEDFWITLAKGYLKLYEDNFM